MTIRCLVILLLLFPVVYADEGRTFELDFNVNYQYDLFLKKSDRVLFEYGGYNNTIIIDEIKANATELDIFLFLEKGPHTPDYQFLGKGFDIRIDFDRDGNRDMSIGLIRNDLENGITYLSFKRLDAWDENAVLDLSNWKIADEKPKKANSLYASIGVTLALLLFISLMLWFYASKKKDGTYF